ncbi:MAG: WD40 repeat domain-containing protein [Pseudomonadota bacterium]
MASASGDKTARIWEIESGRQRAILSGHTGRLQGIAYSPDGRLLATGAFDNLVILWDLSSFSLQQVLTGHKSVVREVAFSPDGKLLASTGADLSIRIWDVASGVQKALLAGHSSEVLVLAFSPDSQLVASAGLDRTIRLWNVMTGESKTLVKARTAPPNGLAFTSDGMLLAGYDLKIVAIDPRGGTESPLCSQHADLGAENGEQAERLYFGLEGRHIAMPASFSDGIVLDRATGERRVLRGHREQVRRVRMSADGKLAATASMDGTLQVWDASTGRPYWRAPVLLPSPSPSPTLLTHRGWIALDDNEAETASQENAPDALPSWRRAIEQRARSASLSSSGEICLRSYEDAIELWDARSDRLVLFREVLARGDNSQVERMPSPPIDKRLPTPSPSPSFDRILAIPGGCLVLARGHLWLVGREQSSNILSDATALAWEEDEILAAIKGQVLVFDRAGTEKARFPSETGVTAVGRVGGYLVLGFKEGHIGLQPLDRRLPIPSFAFEGAPSTAVVRLLAGPPGTLVAGFSDGTLGLWNVQNGTLLDSAKLHGAIAHLLVAEGNLYAATELGDHVVMRLGVFYQRYCDLLAEVWSSVPVVWEQGLPEIRKRPPRHPCAAKQP